MKFSAGSCKRTLAAAGLMAMVSGCAPLVGIVAGVIGGSIAEQSERKQAGRDDTKLSLSGGMIPTVQDTAPGNE
jgi:hypothetical protein